MTAKRDQSKVCAKDGCNSYHIKDSLFCYPHSPKEFRGHNKVDLVVSHDLVSCQKFACQLAMDTKRGKIKPQVASVTGKLIDLVAMIEDKLITQAKLAEMTKALEAYQDLGIENAELASLELESEYKGEDQE